MFRVTAVKDKKWAIVYKNVAELLVTKVHFLVKCWFLVFLLFKQNEPLLKLLTS